MIYFGADHAGFHLKQVLIRHANGLGHETKDFGTDSEASVDYPDFAKEVCLAMEDHPEIQAVLICGTGNGICIAANRFPWIRAALCRTPMEAQMARAHNNANVLCLGGRVTAEPLAGAILETFLTTEFEGGRHERRLEKIQEF